MSVEQWYPIETEEDIEHLMSSYYEFHDACIVSLNFQSGTFVDQEGTMHFSPADKCVLSILFQSQLVPKSVELQFSGLRQLHLFGCGNYLNNISAAYLEFHHKLLPGKPERLIVWSDYSEFDVAAVDNTIQEPADTYVVANALRWRMI